MNVIVTDELIQLADGTSRYHIVMHLDVLHRQFNIADSERIRNDEDFKQEKIAELEVDYNEWLAEQ